MRLVFNLLIVECALRNPATAPQQWSASRFVQDATMELKCLNGTAPDENDYVVNLARSVQLLLSVLQVVHLVRQLEGSQISATDRKTFLDFGELVLRKEPDSWQRLDTAR